MRYILHFFDEHEHLRRSELIGCGADAEAIRIARSQLHPHVVEVWCGERRVCRVEPTPEVALAS